MLKLLRAEFYRGVFRASIWVLGGILAIAVSLNVLNMFSSARHHFSEYVDVLRAPEKYASVDESGDWEDRTKADYAVGIEAMTDEELQACFNYAQMYDVSEVMHMTWTIVVCLVPLTCLAGDVSVGRMGDYVLAGQGRFKTYAVKLIFVVCASMILVALISLLGLLTYFKAWVGHFSPGDFFPWFFKCLAILLPSTISYTCITAAVVFVVKNPAIATPVSFGVLVLGVSRLFDMGMQDRLAAVAPTYAINSTWWLMKSVFPPNVNSSSWLPVYLQSAALDPFPVADFVPYMLAFHAVVAVVGFVAGWIAFRRANLR